MILEHVPPFWSLDAIKGFILDWDGVLANTRLDFSGILKKYFGGATVVPLIESTEKMPPALRDEVRAAIIDVEMTGADRATPVDGALELVEWFKSNHKPWAVVSRNCRDSIELAAKRCGIRLPDVVISREDEVTKPDPRALVLAAKRIGVSPNECVMLGDFFFDMLGARRVPMRCVLVNGNVEAWSYLADLACPTMRDFLDELRNPRALVPWEYRSLVQEHGTEYLTRVNSVPLRVENFRQALTAARAGVTRLVVSGDTKLTLDEWQGLDLDPEFIDQPLFTVLSALLPRRWPAVNLTLETSCV